MSSRRIDQPILIIRRSTPENDTDTVTSSDDLHDSIYGEYAASIKLEEQSHFLINDAHHRCQHRRRLEHTRSQDFLQELVMVWIGTFCLRKRGFALNQHAHFGKRHPPRSCRIRIFAAIEDAEETIVPFYLRKQMFQSFAAIETSVMIAGL